MRIIFTHSAWGDYLWFQEQDRKLIKRINQLIKETISRRLKASENLSGLRAISPVTGHAASHMNIGWFTLLPKAIWSLSLSGTTIATRIFTNDS
jgi:hypothetical protein